MTEPMTVDIALIRLRQYQERPAPTWTTASYGGGSAESTLAEIGRTLAAEVERLRTALATAEKATPPRGATATPDPLSGDDRQDLLLATMREQGGGWTSRRATQVFSVLGYRITRTACRADLRTFVDAGLVAADDTDPNRRVYRLTKKGRSR